MSTALPIVWIFLLVLALIVGIADGVHSDRSTYAPWLSCTTEEETNHE